MNPITLLSIVVTWLAWRELSRSGTAAAAPKSVKIGNVGNTVKIDGLFTNKVWKWTGPEITIAKARSGNVVAQFTLKTGATFIGEGRWETNHPKPISGFFILSYFAEDIFTVPQQQLDTPRADDPNNPANGDLWQQIETAEGGTALVYDPSGIGFNAAGQMWE